MYLLLLLAASAFADTLPLVIQAQTDFERVLLEPAPRIGDAAACVQSAAALMPVAQPEELPQAHYRKGYCLLVEGLLTRDARELDQAGAEFQSAVGAWPVPKGAAPAARPPDADAMRILSSIAGLAAASITKNLPARDSRLESAEERVECAGVLLGAAACQEVAATGRLWLAWLADRQDRLSEAARRAAAFPGSGWQVWVAGRQAFAARGYAAAEESFRQALRIWQTRPAPAEAVRLLSPPPDLPRARESLAAAAFLAGNAAAAVAALDAALQARPQEARDIFLRGLARDAAGSPEAALEDYNLASRTALANAGESSAAGEARYYRAVWLFRRGDYARADREFAAALNTGVDPALRPDVTAWWRMTAVARGECGASARYLEDSLAAASGFFHRRRAQSLLGRCGVLAARQPQP